MKTIALLLLLTQEVSSEKNILLKFAVQNPDEIKAKSLWVTMDGGKTWNPAEKAVKNLRFVAQKQHIYAYVEVPEDGTYGFYLQLEDMAGNKTPPPTESTQPQINVTVDTTRPSIEFKRTDRFLAKSLDTKLSFAFHENNNIKDTSLWFTKDKKKWLAANDSQEVKVKWDIQGNEITAHIQVEAEGTYWFSVQLEDTAGNRTPDPASPDSTVLEVEFSPNIPQIVLPYKNSILMVPNVYVIKWISPASISLKEGSGRLFYRERDKTTGWVQIADNLNPSGIHLWSPPLKDTAVDLKFEIMDTFGNKIVSSVVHGITIRSERKANIKKALELYKTARLDLAQKDYERALKNYYLILEEWSSFPEALNDLANIYYEKKEMEKALEFFYRAQNADKANPKYYLNIAICLFDLNMLENAIEAAHDTIILNKGADPTLAIKTAILLKKIYDKANDNPLITEMLKECVNDLLAGKQLNKETKTSMEQILKEISNANKKNTGESEKTSDNNEKSPNVDKKSEEPEKKEGDK